MTRETREPALRQHLPYSSRQDTKTYFSLSFSSYFFAFLYWMPFITRAPFLLVASLYTHIYILYMYTHTHSVHTVLGSSIQLRICLVSRANAVIVELYLRPPVLNQHNAPLSFCLLPSTHIYIYIFIPTSFSLIYRASYEWNLVYSSKIVCRWGSSGYFISLVFYREFSCHLKRGCCIQHRNASFLFFPPFFLYISTHTLCVCDPRCISCVRMGKYDAQRHIKTSFLFGFDFLV